MIKDHVNEEGSFSYTLGSVVFNLLYLLNKIRFTIEGPASILAVDNGDPMSLEPFRGARSAFNGKCLLILKSTKDQGRISISADSENLEGSTIEVDSFY